MLAKVVQGTPEAMLSCSKRPIKQNKRGVVVINFYKIEKEQFNIS